MKVQSSWLVALLMIPLLGITGCVTTKTVKVLSEPVNSVALNPPNIRDLELQGVKWFIVTPENIDDWINKIQEVINNPEQAFAKATKAKEYVQNLTFTKSAKVILSEIESK